MKDDSIFICCWTISLRYFNVLPDIFLFDLCSDFTCNLLSLYSCNEQFFQSMCEVLSADSEWNPKQFAELLRSLGFSISLIDMLPSRLCEAVGNVFKLLDKEEDLSLSLLPQKISRQGCAYLFSNVKKLQTLR